LLDAFGGFAYTLYGRERGVFDWKVSAYGAGGAFVLSLLVGLFSGNPFGTAFLRALGLGLGFGAFVSGCYAVIARFMPEMLRREPKPGPESQGPTEGKPRIDITLPAEAPVFVGTEAAEDGDDTVDSSFVSFTPERGMVEELQSAETATENVIPVSRSGMLSDIADDVDVLPDLESLSDAFMAAETAADLHEASEPVSSKAPGDGPDPETLASAIRTMMNKTQEGK
jgi:hypothetical protein